LNLDSNYLELLTDLEEEQLIATIQEETPYDNSKALCYIIENIANGLFINRYGVNPQLASIDNVSVVEGQIATSNISFDGNQANISTVEIKLSANDNMPFFNDTYVTITAGEGLEIEKKSFEDNELTIVLNAEEGGLIEKICSVSITAPESSAGAYSFTVNGSAYYSFDDMDDYLVTTDEFTQKTFQMTIYAKNNSNTRFEGGGSSSGSSGFGGGGVNSDFVSKPIQSVKTPDEDKKEAFNDISNYVWAHDAINYLAEKGVISGKSEGVFAPGDKITRSELCKIVVLAFDIPFTNLEGKFTDVPIDSWEYDYVMAAYSAGLINGVSATEFDGNSEIKREDMACIISRYLGMKEESTDLLFNDSAEISDYAKEAVANLYSLKIINGMGDNMFCPKLSVTRAQAAQVVYNVITEG